VLYWFEESDTLGLLRLYQGSWVSLQFGRGIPRLDEADRCCIKRLF
jgi:hypothetical protein